MLRDEFYWNLDSMFQSLRRLSVAFHRACLSEAGESSTKPTAVSRGTDQVHSEELAALTKQIASLEKREDRYSVFRQLINILVHSCLKFCYLIVVARNFFVVALKNQGFMVKNDKFD